MLRLIRLSQANFDCVDEALLGVYSAALLRDFVTIASVSAAHPKQFL